METIGGLSRRAIGRDGIPTNELAVARGQGSPIAQRDLAAALDSGNRDYFAIRELRSACSLATEESDIEPGAKMLFARPAAPIETDFGEDPLHCQQVEAG